jgi:mannose-6-phosphate isomerase-like protein (cupin superfamily)
MVLSYACEANWLDRSKYVITQALNLRDDFFSKIYDHLQKCKFNNLLNKISSHHHVVPESRITNFSALKSSIHSSCHNSLYYNEDASKTISFTVDRVPFHADVLDPRIVKIPVGFNNELHNHAHETIFLIIKGEGEVYIDDTVISIKAGDLIYVPRWSQHQTRNTGTEELQFFAITDYGLTRRLSQNSESIYRQNKDNLYFSKEIR